MRRVFYGLHIALALSSLAFIGSCVLGMVTPETPRIEWWFWTGLGSIAVVFISVFAIDRMTRPRAGKEK